MARVHHEDGCRWAHIALAHLLARLSRAPSGPAREAERADAAREAAAIYSRLEELDPTHARFYAAQRGALPGRSEA